MSSTRELAYRLPIAAVCLGLVAGCLFASPAWAAFPGDNGKLAFTSDRDSANFIYDIYSMDSSGPGSAARLTTHAASDLDPAWSPDGQKIAFMSARDGNLEIYVMDADGTNQTRLTKDATGDTFPAWSPDGQKIAFTANRDGNSEIYVMDATVEPDPADECRGHRRCAGLVPRWPEDHVRQLARRQLRDLRDERERVEPDAPDDERGNRHLSRTGRRTARRSRSPAERDGNFEVYSMNAADGTGLLNLSTTPAPTSSPPGHPTARRSPSRRSATSSGTDTEIFVMNATARVRRT